MTTFLTHTPAWDDHELDVPTGGSEPASGGRHRHWLLGAALLVLLVGAHLALGAFMRGPIIHPDELGYIDNARYLAHGGIKPDTEYYPGLSLLLVPLWLISRDPLTVWRGAIEINAVLAGLGGVVAWMLCARLTPGLSARQRLGVTAVVCAYPALLLYSDLALAESLFVALFGVVVLLAGRALPGRSPGWWGTLGVASGLLALVHPRGFAVVVAVVLSAIVVLRPWRRDATVAGLALATGLTLSLSLTQVLVRATRGNTLSGFAAYQPGGILAKSLSVHGALSLVSEAGGQLFYLSVATLGLVPLGLVLAGRSIRRVLAGDRGQLHLSRAFAAVSFLGVWGLSSLFMNLGDRADKLIYGRYNEGAIVPLLVISLADIVSAERLRHFSSDVRHAHAARRWILVGIPAVAISAGALLVGRSAAELHGDLNPVNVLGIYPLLRGVGGIIHVVAFAAVGAGAIAALAILGRRRPAIGIAGVAMVFVASAIDIEAGYLVPGSQARSEQNVIATTIAEADARLGLGLSCVGYDPSAATTFNYFQTQFLLPGRRFLWLDSASSRPPCGPLVISGNADFPSRFPGSRMITVENDVEQSLWALPGPVQERLGAAGWLLPDPTPGPIPLAARHAALRFIDGTSGVSVTATSTARLRIRATHDSGGSPWPAKVGIGQGAYSVGLLVRWYRPDELPTLASEDGHPALTTTVELPHTVLPGDGVTLDVPLAPRRANGEPLAPGRYVVRLNVYQEGTPAFTDPGLVIDVTVR